MGYSGIFDVGIVDKGFGLIGSGHLADDVEIGAADKYGVGAEDGLNIQLGEFGKDQAVDFVGWNQRRLILKNRIS